MNTTKISKVNLSEVDVALAKERAKITNDARLKLGYEPSRINTAGAELLAALKQCGITPFNRVDVARYMRSKAKSQIRTSGWVRMAFIFVLTVLGFFDIMGIAGKYHYAEGVCFGIGVGTVIVVIATIIALSPDFTSAKRWREWQTKGLHSYEGAVPEMALIKALQIKEVCPNANFVVWELVQKEERKTPRWTNDPFLEVVLGGESYFIDAWDEKDFRADY